MVVSPVSLFFGLCGGLNGIKAHHRLPLRRNRYIFPPLRGQIKMPRTKLSFVSGRIPRIRGATQIDPVLRDPLYAYDHMPRRITGPHPVRHYLLSWKAFVLPSEVHSHGDRTAIPPSAALCHRLCACYSSSSMVSSDVRIIAQYPGFVKVFLQFFNGLLAFFRVCRKRIHGRKAQALPAP